MELIASFDIGIINLACCIFDTNEIIHYWNIFDISASTSEKRCRNMVRQLNKVEMFKEISTVLIEIQPQFNPKARLIQQYVRDYFLIRSVDFDKDIKVVEYSAVHKLSCYEGECPDYTHLKSEYRQRKKLSIYHCSQIIIRPEKIQDQKFIEQFNASKKKDDYADSYLQGLSFIRFRKDKMEKSFIIGKVTKRKPSPKQYRYKKFSRANLKYLLIEDLEKCTVSEQETKENDIVIFIDDFIKEWIEKRKGVKNAVLTTYDLEDDPDMLKKDIVPEIYLDRGYTTQFVGYQKKEKIPKMKKKPTVEEDITINDGL
jgi:hypothetical protein